MDSELRRPLLALVIGVAILDAVAISAFYALSIPDRPALWKYSFGALWLGLTMYIVLRNMAALRAIRIRRRRGR